MKALCLGVHVLDVLVRPVESLPEDGGALVEQIRLTAAGSAGGTALVLAKLGAEVRSAGAVGTDAAGDMLLALLQRDGVDTSLLQRREEVQTSASVLPIRPDGGPSVPGARTLSRLRALQAWLDQIPASIEPHAIPDMVAHVLLQVVAAANGIDQDMFGHVPGPDEPTL